MVFQQSIDHFKILPMSMNSQNLKQLFSFVIFEVTCCIVQLRSLLETCFMKDDSDSPHKICLQALFFQPKIDHF